MNPLYIFDLDETTGAYYTYPGVNDIILLRAGFKEILKLNEEGKLEMIIATRGKADYVEDIKRNLRERGINLACKTYSEEDVSLGDFFGYYKSYKRILREMGIDSPAQDSVVIGDLLRIGSNENYSREEFVKTDFQREDLLLGINYSLNDHPLPIDGESPVYVVMPRPIVNEDGNGSTLDLMVVLRFLNEMYGLGGNNFEQGFEKVNGNLAQKVVSDRLAKRMLGYGHKQKYLIMKGEREHWKPLEKIM